MPAGFAFCGGLGFRIYWVGVLGGVGGYVYFSSALRENTVVAPESTGSTVVPPFDTRVWTCDNVFTPSKKSHDTVP